MDLKEILKSQGYTDEQIKAIMDLMAENKLYVSSVENAGETIRKLQEEKKKLEDDSAALREELDKQAGSKSEEAAGEIRKLQETVQKTQIDLQLVRALTKANAADVDYMLYQAEKSGGMKNIKVNDDGSVSGVDELVEALKKNHAAQFASPQTGTQEMVRTGVKKLENSAAADETPQTLEEAIAQKLAGEGA